MKLNQQDVATALVLFVAIGQWAASPAFVQMLNSIASDPWPVKISTIFALLGSVAALVLARLTPNGGTEAVPPQSAGQGPQEK